MAAPLCWHAKHHGHPTCFRLTSFNGRRFVTSGRLLWLSNLHEQKANSIATEFTSTGCRLLCYQCHSYTLEKAARGFKHERRKTLGKFVGGVLRLSESNDYRKYGDTIVRELNEKLRNNRTVDKCKRKINYLV